VIIQIDRGATSSGVINVRFGSLADISALISDVRFAPESGHGQRRVNVC